MLWFMQITSTSHQTKLQAVFDLELGKEIQSELVALIGYTY
jgi:hypothetical protein